MFNKANKFLSKDNVNKEKLKIKNDIKSNFIALGKDAAEERPGKKH